MKEEEELNEKMVNGDNGFGIHKKDYVNQCNHTRNVCCKIIVKKRHKQLVK